MTDTAYKIKVMQAFEDGKTIQENDAATGWRDNPDPTWNWQYTKYRIKPREPREIYIEEQDDGTLSGRGWSRVFSPNKHVKFIEVIDEETGK